MLLLVSEVVVFFRRDVESVVEVGRRRAAFIEEEKFRERQPVVDAEERDGE